MRFVDWKLYTSAAIGAILGAFGLFGIIQPATMGLIPVIAIGSFLLLYLAFILVEFLYEQVQARA